MSLQAPNREFQRQTASFWVSCILKPYRNKFSPTSVILIHRVASSRPFLAIFRAVWISFSSCLEIGEMHVGMEKTWSKGYRTKQSFPSLLGIFVIVDLMKCNFRHCLFPPITRYPFSLSWSISYIICRSHCRLIGQWITISYILVGHVNFSALIGSY